MKILASPILKRLLALTALFWVVIFAIRTVNSHIPTLTPTIATGEPGTQLIGMGWFGHAALYDGVLLLLWIGVFSVGAWAVWTEQTNILAFIVSGTLIFTWPTPVLLGGDFFPAAIILLAVLIMNGLQKQRVMPPHA